MSAVRSPCIAVCALDKQDVCMGCYRSMEEIAQWRHYSDEEKRAVLRQANERCREKYG